MIFTMPILFYSEDNWVELDESEIKQSKLHAGKQLPHSQAPESGIRRL